MPSKKNARQQVTAPDCDYTSNITQATPQELMTWKLVTGGLRSDLKALEDEQEQRIECIQQDINKSEEAIRSLKLSQYGGGGYIDRARILKSGLPPPPINKDMDWENDSDTEDAKNTILDGKTLAGRFTPL
jgi:hypothetical protein